MATIDPRLLPLIETLMVSGADWLAFEILDGIRSGRPAEDSEEEAKKARLAVRSFRQRKAPPLESKVRETFVEPLVGDAQIEFAAAYVIDRTSQAIEMARLALQQLDQIALRSHGRSGPLGGDFEHGGHIQIRLEDNNLVLSQSQAEEAQGRLPELRRALSAWSHSVRQGEREE